MAGIPFGILRMLLPEVQESTGVVTIANDLSDTVSNVDNSNTNTGTNTTV